MLGVQGRGDVLSKESHAPQTPVEESPVGRWIAWSGVGVVILGAFGAAFPYFSNGLGLPLDGAADGAMTTWRTVLHLIPGVLGIVAGVALITWGRRRAAGIDIDPAAGRFIARATVVIGGWFALGPYLYGIVSPSQAHGTGGHAGMMAMPHMSWLSNVMMPVNGTMKHMPTTANCALTMGVDHWFVGGLIVFGGLVALGAGLGQGPLGPLLKAGSSQDLSGSQV